MLDNGSFGILKLLLLSKISSTKLPDFLDLIVSQLINTHVGQEKNHLPNLLFRIG